jgi:glutaredoxin
VSKNRKTLIGIYKADGGILGELSYFFGHLVGVRSCSLCDITHSPIKKKNDFKAFEKRLLEERGIAFRLVHMNERTEAELVASAGREPCVLLQYEDGSISMFLDFVELKTSKGSVRSFEKLVESRLNIYL